MLRKRAAKTNKTPRASSMSPPPSLSPPTSCVHQGKKKYASKPAIIMEPQDQDDPRRPLRGDTDPDSDSDSESLFERRRRRRCPPPLSYDSIIIREEDDTMDYLSSHKSHWIFLAVASGACAAFNGVFAKLTTTDLTRSFANSIVILLGLGNGEKVIEVIIRAMFFGLNLIFNGVMWTLFTKALARGTSTTKVSIINTSSNFMITAILGFFIFTESLPLLWWVGAAMLVAGNVIIGSREDKDASQVVGDDFTAAESGEGSYSEEVSTLLEDTGGLDGDVESAALKKAPQEEDDALILELDDEEVRPDGELK